MKTNIESTRFGTLEINDQAVLNFPDGLIGFETCKHFTLLHEDHSPPGGDGNGKRRELKEEQNIVHYLQSLDDPDISLPVVDPMMFGFNYDLTLTGDDIDALQVKAGDYVAVLLVIGKYQEDRYREDLPARQNISANISAPIIINTRSCIGMQKILKGLTYDLTLRAGTGTRAGTEAGIGAAAAGA